jgi:glycosyltransferase involved in cell wall biosynthesis
MPTVHNGHVRVVQLNYAYDPRLRSAIDLTDRYASLTGWSEALAAAGAAVLTVQRFHSSARLTRNNLPYVFGPLSVITRATAAFAPDVVHVNGLSFPVQTWWLRRVVPRSAAVVVQDHASGHPAARSLAVNALRRWLMHAPDAFLFTAIEQADSWRDRRFIARDQAVYSVMEASTNIRPMPRDDARAASGVTGTPALLWVGRLNANKDPLTVLSAFERLAASVPNATLTMIYHERDLLHAVRESAAASRWLRETVRLVGEVSADRMSAFFSAADLFVVGSHWEGSGYALMEAIACGTIPVVTNIPAFRALTGHGSIGALWMPGHIDECAHALLAINSHDLATERQRVRDHFERELSWTAVAARALSIYREVVERRRK